MNVDRVATGNVAMVICALSQPYRFPASGKIVRITRITVGRLAKTTEDEAELCGFDPLPCPVCEDVRGTIHDLGGCPACGGLGVTETALDAFKRFWDAMHPDGEKWSDDPIVAFIELEKVADHASELVREGNKR